MIPQRTLQNMFLEQDSWVFYFFQTTCKAPQNCKHTHKFRVKREPVIQIFTIVIVLKVTLRKIINYYRYTFLCIINMSLDDYQFYIVFGEMSVRQKVSRWSVLTAKCPHGKVSLLRGVLIAKYPYGKMSVLRSVRTVKYPTAKCPSAKSLTAKSPGTAAPIICGGLFAYARFTETKFYELKFCWNVLIEAPGRRLYQNLIYHSQ